MISSCQIRNFKGIHECEIDDLKKINLFIGKNNSCKSTILEAMYYTLKEFYGKSELPQVFRRRNNVYCPGQDLWFYHNTDEDIKIKIDLVNSVLTLELRFDEEHSSIRCSTSFFDKKSSAKFTSSGIYSVDLDVVRSVTFSMPTTEDTQIKKFVNDALFLESSVKYDVDSIEKLLGLLKTKNLASEFGEYLNRIFGLGQNWEFLPVPNRPKEFRAALIEKNKYLYISGLGDGIRYAIQVLGNAMLIRDSCIFIEEIETNQHPEALKKLIPILLDISRKNNLQIIVTTQSPLTWTIFEHEFADPSERDAFFQCFHVQRNMEDGTVNCKIASRKDYDVFWNGVMQDLYGTQ